LPFIIALLKEKQLNEGIALEAIIRAIAQQKA
jgi:hypothetical protein